MRESIALMRQVHGSHKFGLKVGINRRFNVAHPTSQARRFSPPVQIEQGNPGPVTGCIPDRIHLGQVTIGNEAQNHGRPGINKTAESACQQYPIQVRNPGPHHEQFGSGI
jgi:hypothetical protein